MPELHIPTHIDMTRRIAVQETATVTDLTVTEQKLRVQYDEHQQGAAAERDRIEAELRAVREQADKRLAALAEDERRLGGELTDVGRRLRQHRDEAEQAQQSIADWCTRQGVSPADLPPLRDTGPMPVVAAPKAIEPGGKCGECLAPMPGAHYPQCPQAAVPTPPENSQPLPALDAPDALLEAGRKAADPGATRTDLPGGDQPGQGDFQGDTDA